MKTILEFTLPEDQSEYETASNGWKYSYILHETLEMLRHTIKYDEEASEEVRTYAESLRNSVNDLMLEHSLPE